MTEMLESAFSLCKTTAVTRNETIVLFFDSDENRFRAVMESGVVWLNGEPVSTQWKDGKMVTPVVPWTSWPEQVEVVDESGIAPQKIEFSNEGTCTSRVYLISDSAGHAYRFETYAAGALWEVTHAE